MTNVQHAEILILPECHQSIELIEISRFPYKAFESVQSLFVYYTKYVDAVERTNICVVRYFISRIFSSANWKANK